MEEFRRDGLDALRCEIGTKEIAGLVERTAKWVDPATFRRLPVWYPEHARGWHLYKADWSEPQTNTNRASRVRSHKMEANVYASKALTLALGLKAANRPNWSCCHIWGIDDPTYQSTNAIVRDHRFYSCVGNMILLPTPLKAFTDSLPELKAMLRLCARNLYGWECDHEKLVAAGEATNTGFDQRDYPKSWPSTQDDQKKPQGIITMTSAVERSVKKRIEQIRNGLRSAAEHYPRERVKIALQYWKAKGFSIVADDEL